MNQYLHYFFVSGTRLVRSCEKRKAGESYAEAVARLLKDNEKSATPIAYVRLEFRSLADVQNEFVIVSQEHAESEGTEWNRQVALRKLAEEMVFFASVGEKKEC